MESHEVFYIRLIEYYLNCGPLPRDTLVVNNQVSSIGLQFTSNIDGKRYKFSFLWLKSKLKHEYSTVRLRTWVYVPENNYWTAAYEDYNSIVPRTEDECKIVKFFSPTFLFYLRSILS